MDRRNPAHGNEDERNFGLQKRASFTDEGAIVGMISRTIRASSSRIDSC